MALLSTNSRLVRVGTDYSAGSGISIDDHVISVTGEFGKTYSAGENVDIYEQGEQLYISSKDWNDDIANASANAYNEATAQIPDPFDPSYLSAQIDNKLNSSDFTNWQNTQYSTDLQTIEGQISNKLDESAFSQVSASFLTAINIPESATWNEVSQAYEQASGTYLTSVSIPESATWNDVSTTVQSNSAQWAEGGTGDEEVNSFVYNNSANILDVDTTYQENSASYLTSHQDISYKLDTTAFSTVSGDFITAAPADMATTGDVAELAQTISETYQVKGDYLTTADSANFYPMTGNPSSFATENWVTEQGYITGVDLSEYAKRDFVLSSIESATSGKLDVSSFASVSSDFLVAESLNGYATEQWVGEQGYLTEVSIPESANWNEATTTVQTNSSNWDNVTNKLDTTSFSDVSSTFLTAVDLTPYQTIEGMTAYQPVGDYATTAEVDTLSSMLSAAIDYVSANAGDEFPISADEAIQYVQSNSANIDETVTSFQTNSSTYMVEPNLEYNAVNEISGYNGSAIAQYGAEKQWLVHDDTLVHAANSAQYALGVNLSAVAQLLGVDETVLWSDTTNGLTSGSLVLNEPWSGFEKIRLYVVDQFGWGGSCMTFDTTNLAEARTKHFACTYSFIVTGSPNKTYNRGIQLEFANGQYISGTSVGLETRFTPTSTIESITSGGSKLIKVIGIGRKQ